MSSVFAKKAFFWRNFYKKRQREGLKKPNVGKGNKNA